MFAKFFEARKKKKDRKLYQTLLHNQDVIHDLLNKIIGGNLTPEEEETKRIETKDW